MLVGIRDRERGEIQGGQGGGVVCYVNILTIIQFLSDDMNCTDCVTITYLSASELKIF